MFLTMKSEKIIFLNKIRKPLEHYIKKDGDEMKKLVVIFIVVMVVVLGLFFWSISRENEEAEQSGTLVYEKMERGGDYV